MHCAATILCIIMTAYPYVMDKALYATTFGKDIYLNQIFKDSIGLWIIEKILHIFTYNPMILFFTISYIYSYITLHSFECYLKHSKNSSKAIILLLLSEYTFFGFYMLKQCIAIALVTLALIKNIYENKNIIKYFIIAILFHESAIIAFLIYLITKYINNKFVAWLGMRSPI